MLFFFKENLLKKLNLTKLKLTESTSDAAACPLDKSPNKLLLDNHHLLLDHPDNRYGRPNRLIHPLMRVEGAQTQKAFLWVFTMYRFFYIQDLFTFSIKMCFLQKKKLLMLTFKRKIKLIFELSIEIMGNSATFILQYNVIFKIKI